MLWKLVKRLLTTGIPAIALLSQGSSGSGTSEIYDAPLLPRFDVASRSSRRRESYYGKVKHYDFTVTREYRAPDGLNRSLILVNGMYPGPKIEVNLGDTISVTVTNEIDSPEEGTSIHWHGLSQKNSPQFDGVPSITQCPIAPGSSFTYTFKPDVAGTTMYHSHYSAQYMDGLFGALIVHGPKTTDYDIDLGPVFLTDYSHTDYLSYLIRVYDIPPTFLPIENNLINGKMFYDCKLETQGRACTPDASISKFQFETGKKHLLRIINSGGSATQKFSIDGHKLTIVANDFVPVKPYTVDVATVGVGQRTDVVVTATGKKTDAFWMRADLDVPCSNATIYQPNALAAVYYPRADKRAKPTTKGYTWDSMDCRNDPLERSEPLIAKPVPEPTFTDTIDITAAPNGTGHLVFFLNGINFRANYSASILSAVAQGQTQFPRDYSVHDYGKNTSIRLIIRNHFPIMHNIHLHGHSYFYVLAEGYGDWDGKIVRPGNPQRRDGQQMMMGTEERPAYLVIQFDADNPGVWALHCHLVVHASAGMYWNIIERSDLIRDRKIGDVAEATCENWNSFIEDNEIDQFDSGLRI